MDYVTDESGRPFAGVYAAGSDTVPFLMVTTDRGDVRELLDSNGEAFAHYAYDVYGNPTATLTTATGGVDGALAQALASRQVLRYAGCTWDAETSLYYCSQRYYDPRTAAFISKDPARADGEESAYQYCGGDPVGGVDPTGLKKISNFIPRRQQQGRDNCFAIAMLVCIHQQQGRWANEDDVTEYWYADCPYVGVEGWSRCDFGCWSKRHFRKQIRTHMLRASGGGKRTRSWAQIKREVNANRPILAGGGASSKKPNHAWVIGGYQVKDGEKQVYVASWNALRWVSLQDLKSSDGASFLGSKFTWTHSVWGIRDNR